MPARHRPRSVGSAAALAIAWLVLAAACGPADTRPNVLLVTVDTLRADHLGTYGFPVATSPRIDTLAERSVVFERAIAAAAMTAPAHASILTSRFTREHAIGHGNGSTALGDEITLAEAFRDAEFDTAGFVGNILLTRRTGLGRGFDLFDDELVTPELNRPHVVERLARDTTERALAWVDSRGARPFFLWVHYQDPHGPYTPPAAYAERLEIPPRAGERSLPVLADNSSGRGIPAYQVLPGMRRPSDYESRYAAEILYADHWIGELTSAVLGHASGRPAVLLLTADHGESLGEEQHWFSHTHTTTPDVARVPFILRAPGLRPERRSELVSHVDVLPTLLKLAGLPAPPGAQGAALGPVLRDGGDVPSRWLYTDNGHELAAYRGDRFLRLRNVGGAWTRGARVAPRVEAFRWSTDPSDRSPPWTPTGAEAVPPDVADYVARAIPMRPLPPPDAEMTERLRALGYVD